MSTNTQSPSNGTSSASAAPLGDVAERLGPKLEEAQEQLTQLNERIKGFIRQNPGTTLLGAAALGYLIGRWASRK